MRGTDPILRFLDGFESARGHKSKDCRSQTDYALARNQHRAAQDVSIDLVERIVFLRNAAGVDHAFDVYAVSGHAVENDARMKRCAFDGCKEFILRRALQIPAERDAAKVGVHEHRAVAVIPGHAQQAGLSGAIFIEAGAQCFYIGSGAGSDGIEDVSHGGEPRFDSRAQGMHAPLHHAADSRHQIHRRSDSDDACGGADDVHHVVSAATGADRVPMRIEGSDGNRNAGLETELFRPECREPAGDLIGGGVLALESCRGRP